MSLTDIKNLYQTSKLNTSLDLALQSGTPSTIALEGLVGSTAAFVTAALYKKKKQPLLLILEDKEQAAYFFNDLENIMAEEQLYFFPASHNRPYQIEAVDNANVLLRAETIQALQNTKNPFVIVSYAEALFEKVSTRKELLKYTLAIKSGQNL